MGKLYISLTLNFQVSIRPTLSAIAGGKVEVFDFDEIARDLVSVAETIPWQMIENVIELINQGPPTKINQGRLKKINQGLSKVINQGPNKSEDEVSTSTMDYIYQICKVN